MNTAARVRKIIADCIVPAPASAVVDAACLGSDLGADSLDQVDILNALEYEFGAAIPDQDAERWHRVADVVRYCEERFGPGDVA